MNSCLNFEGVYHSVYSSNLTCIYVSQEAVKVVWYSHHFKNFPQSVVIHTLKGFSIVNEAEVDIFLEFPYFFYDPTDVGSLISGSFAFSKTFSKTPSIVPGKKWTLSQCLLQN